MTTEPEESSRRDRTERFGGRTHRQLGRWVSVGAILCAAVSAMSVLVPVASATQVIAWGAPYYNESVTNGGGIGCNGGNTDPNGHGWINSQASSSGYIYQYSYSWNQGYSGCGVYGPWSSTKGIQSYAYSASVDWSYGTGTYVLYEQWYYAYQATANNTGGSGCIPGSNPDTSLFIEVLGNMWDKTSGSFLDSSTPTQTLVSTSLTNCPQTYSSSSATTGYLFDVGSFHLTNGVTYQAFAELFSQTVGSSSASSGGDASIDMYDTQGGQQNYA